MSQKKYFEEIDIIKGIAIVLVILGHSIIVYPIDLHKVYWCRLLHDSISSMHMPLFFFVSGYCFSSTINLNSYGDYIYKKIRRILIPFFAFNFLDAVPRAILSSLVNTSRNGKEAIYSILFHGGAYWFCYSLFTMFLIFPIVAWIIKINRCYAFGILGICVLIRLGDFLPEVFLLNKTGYFFLFFVSGYLVKCFIGMEKISLRVLTHNNIWMLIAVGGIIFVGFMAPFYDEISKNAFSILTAFAGILASMIFGILLKWSNYVKNLLIRFGKHSLQLYLFNGFFLVFSRILVVNILHFQTPALIILANWFIDLFVAYALIICLKRFKTFRILSGIV